MIKVCLLPGVGFQEDEAPSKLLVDNLKKEFNVTWFNWKNKLPLPSIELPHKWLRNFLAESILDFQTAVKHADTIVVPEADIYIGHSAGSIIALCQKKPAIIFGSPAIIVEEVQFKNVIAKLSKAKPVYNIVNRHDPFAYPIPFIHVENYLFSSTWWNPIRAHTVYYRSQKISKKIIKWINNNVV